MMTDNAPLDAYMMDSHIAEVYDQTETYTDDIEFICRLLGDTAPLRILEPFCGTGRILIPLALAGHSLVGFDRAQGMLELARPKVALLPDDAQGRIAIFQADALTSDWPVGFDLVILGGNCFYGLSSASDQLSCIRAAYASLREGGLLYVDNNCRRGRVTEGDLRWRGNWPTGVCADGTRLAAENAMVAIDTEKNLWHETRKLHITLPNGIEQHIEWAYTVHPVSMEEVCGWLAVTGFTILGLYGNRQGAAFTADDRAIFWARK